MPRSEDLRVLVADDSKMQLKIVIDICSRLGVEVDAVNDGISAVELAEQNSSSYGIFITDLHMPGDMDGCRAASRIHAIDPAIDIYLMSGSETDSAAGSEQEEEKGDSAEDVFTDFWLKPVPRKVMEDAILASCCCSGSSRGSGK
jgi:CheY-like chemotaxis protein